MVRLPVTRPMRTGKAVNNLVTKDERKDVLRTPMWEGLDDLWELINFLTEEKTEIVRGEKVSGEAQID